MKRTAIKIFFGFVFLATTVSVILLGINFFGFAYVASDTRMHIRGKSPQGMLDRVSENFEKTEDGFVLKDKSILSKECWYMLIDEGGDVIWSENMPDDIPLHYSINDVARMTKWFLNDYPVYVRTEDYGLMVLGIPKNAVGKFDMEYSMEWFDSLPYRLLFILLLNVILAAALAGCAGSRFYKNLKALISGINDLRQEKNVKLKESGIFREVAGSINRTSAVMERKNLTLSQREQARSNWISGISHDIRTPLAVITGYSEELAENAAVEEDRKRAEAITAQSMKIKKLIEDLNLISSLEYDMQPSKKTAVRVCSVLRGTVTDIMNGGIDESFNISMDLRDEAALIMADEGLMKRAVFNLVNNAVVHNKGGCDIKIMEYTVNDMVHIMITDNGRGADEDVIKNIGEIPKSAHGMGLPMAYRIIRSHGGDMSMWNNNGFNIHISLQAVKS